MNIQLKEFLAECGIEDAFYPGKKLVRKCRQNGEFKSHSVVLDWRDPSKVRIEVVAGLSGRTLPLADLKKYPIAFQSPTYVEIEIVNDNVASDRDEDEDEEKGKSGKSGGDSKGQKKKTSLSEMARTFGEVIEGKIPELGKVTEMMIMGKEIAAEAYQSVLMSLTRQIDRARVCTSELMAKTGSLVTKFTPPSFMKPTGDETASYQYDREKNADIGFRAPVIG